MRIMLNNFRYSLMDYKFKGEQALRASGGFRCWTAGTE